MGAGAYVVYSELLYVLFLYAAWYIDAITLSASIPIGPAGGAVVLATLDGEPACVDVCEASAGALEPAKPAEANLPEEAPSPADPTPSARENDGLELDSPDWDKPGV